MGCTGFMIFLFHGRLLGIPHMAKQRRRRNLVISSITRYKLLGARAASVEI